MSNSDAFEEALDRVRNGQATASDLEFLRNCIQRVSQLLDERQLYDPPPLLKQDVESLLEVVAAVSTCPNDAAVAWTAAGYLEAQQRSAELEALRQASLSLTSSLDLQEVLDTILENTLKLLDDAQDAHIHKNHTMGFGIAIFPGDFVTGADLIAEADRALYEGKENDQC